MQCAPSQERPRKRRRPALACAPCRRRKVRCDREEPCGPCSQLGGGSGASACWYTADQDQNALGNKKVSSATNPPGVQSTIDISSVPTQIVRDGYTSDLPPHWPNSASQGDDAFMPHETTGQFSAPNIVPKGVVSSEVPSQVQSTLQLIASRLQRLENNSTDHPRPAVSSKAASPSTSGLSGSLSVSATLPSLRSDHEKPKFWGNTHYRHFFDQRFSLFGRLKSKDASQDPKGHSHVNGIVHLVDRCRDLRRQLKESRRSTAVDPFPNLAGTIPSKDVCHKLVIAYLKSIESIYRILHVPTFWAQLDHHWDSIDQSPPLFRIKLLLVMAIGSAFTPSKALPSEFRADSTRWTHAAQWLLTGPSERMTFNLDGLQIRCLLFFACQTNAVGTKASRWMFAASVRRSAYVLGLHRDPSHFPDLAPLECELRRRLWATVMEIDVQAAFDANMPYDALTNASDCGPPMSLSDGEAEETGLAQLRDHVGEQPSQTVLQVLLFRYLPLRIAVIRFINATTDEYAYAEALRLGSDLRVMRREIQAFLESSRQDSQILSDPFAIFHAKYLDSMALRYTLFLNRPFAIEAMQDPRFYYSRKECCDASFALLTPIANGDLFPGGIYNLPPGTIGSVSGAVSFDAIIYLCLELTRQFEEQGPQQPSYLRDVSQDSRAQIISLLRKVRDRLMDSISEGDTSLKKFIFLASALSQIEATAAGRPAEHALAETLQTSLEQCKNMLLKHIAVEDIPAEADFSDMFDMNMPLPEFGVLEDIESWLQSSTEVNEFGQGVVGL